MGSIDTSQLQGHGFDPELGLIPLQSFACSPCVSHGIPLGDLVSSHCPKTYRLVSWLDEDELYSLVLLG